MIPRLSSTVARVLLVGLAVAGLPCRARADTGGRSGAEDLPALGGSGQWRALLGRPVTAIEVRVDSKLWPEHPELRRVRLGEPLSLELARRAMRELTDTGRYASAEASALARANGVVLVIEVVPRRLLASAEVVGGVGEPEEILRAADVRSGSEVTEVELERIRAAVAAHHRQRGYPSADARVAVANTSDPDQVALSIEVRPGPPLVIGRRLFVVAPTPDSPGIRELLDTYTVETGDRADEERLSDADRSLEALLVTRGWHRAKVSHRLETTGASALLRVRVDAGPLIRIVFEGNRHFDEAVLEDSFELEETSDRSPAALAQRLRGFYVEHGFLDVETRVEERGAPDAAVHDLVFSIREHRPVQVVAREYPCLSGARSAADVGSEIDSFLSEELPGGELLSSVDAGTVDATFAPRNATGARPTPHRPNPWKTYAPDVYERALKHVQDLYRSEGYLSASVGPVQVLRRACHKLSPPGGCLPVGPRRRPATVCSYDEVGLPLEEPPPDPLLACVPDPARGLFCEPEVVLHIPIKLGPRTQLYDVAFDGNQQLLESDLRDAADLTLGDPVSQLELERATRRLLDAYAEEGFAFAEAEPLLEFSPDRTRARVRFVISERAQVHVGNIIIQGARLTSEALIRRRVALTPGGIYRRSDVRTTEERLATLGVFSSITVGLEDPYVPSRRKNVTITVVERRPQYVDVRPGVSTGEGLRITFEYGNRNFAGEAIQLTLRAQLGYLPLAFILDEDVRRKYEDLSPGERLERRNSASLEFPEIGLGPMFRLNVEAIDVRDNARDFGLTKDAGIVTLIFRPERRFSLQLGASLELNDAQIFGSQALRDYISENIDTNPGLANLFRVPEGTSLAIAQRLGATWDRRDNPLGATSGTLVSASAEHVRAIPVGETADAEGDPTDPFRATTSDFMRYTARVAGYVRLNERGLALAVSLRGGVNQQLIPGSRTYPDRLFFLGGMDSIRGFLQDSLVPEDIAQELLHPQDLSAPLNLRQVVIRGGDAFINPRAELRIPLTTSVATALFVDAGNLWTEPKEVRPWKLRYSVGTGLRMGTPIGPLVFDYGFNVQRILDELGASSGRQRFWETLGAFHFSIGLF